MSEVRVNLETRREFAELLRQFFSGRMTNYEYADRAEELACRGGDDATSEIFWAVWHLYCDIFKHTMTTPDRRVPRHVYRVIARIVVFLRSDDGYTPPHLASAWRSLFRLPLLRAVAALVVTGVALLWSPLAAIGPAITAAAFFKKYLFPAGEPVVIRDDVVELFSRNSTSCWPFPSHEALSLAAGSPTYLRGVAA